MERQDFKALLAFSLGVQLLAVLFTWGMLASRYEVEAYEPFGNSNVTEASLNAASLLLPAVLATLVLIVLLRIFGLRIFVYLVAMLPLGIVVILNPEMLTVILNFVIPEHAGTLALVSTAVLAGVVIYSTLRRVRWLANAATFLIAAEVGAYLALTLKPPTLFLAPLVFALYDIYAVFAGPLKTLISQLVKASSPKLKGKPSVRRVRRSLDLGVLAVNVGGYTLGTGDLVFYSLIVSGAFLLSGPVAAAVTMVLMNFGFAMTFEILRRYKKALPGLPLPVLLGVITAAAFHYLL